MWSRALYLPTPHAEAPAPQTSTAATSAGSLDGRTDNATPTGCPPWSSLSHRSSPAACRYQGIPTGQRCSSCAPFVSLTASLTKLSTSLSVSADDSQSRRHQFSVVYFRRFRLDGGHTGHYKVVYKPRLPSLPNNRNKAIQSLYSTQNVPCARVPRRAALLWYVAGNMNNDIAEDVTMNDFASNEKLPLMVRL
jgi:hypothetical protein